MAKNHKFYLYIDLNGSEYDYKNGQPIPRTISADALNIIGNFTLSTYKYPTAL